MKPNVLVVLTDDMAAVQLDAMPQTMARLVTPGVRFERAFVSAPLCAPNRASLYSGRLAHNHGVVGNDFAARDFDDTQTLATWLQAAGYRTGQFGKWINGMRAAEIAPWPYTAPGWHDWKVCVDPAREYYDYKMIVNGTIVTFGTGPSNYKTTVIGQWTRDFILTAPAEQPIFAVASFNAPHAPSVVATDADKTYASQFPFEPTAAYNEADVSDKPAFVRALPLLTADDDTTIRRQWKKQVGTLQAVDREMAGLLDALEQSGRAANTYVLFTSDNGRMNGEHRIADGKSCVYDPCARVLCVVKGPTVVPRVDTEHLVSTVDLTATIAALAGVTAPHTLDGRDLTPVLANLAPAWREHLLIELLAEDNRRPPFAALRARTDVYVEYATEREYYDLAIDPQQLENRITDPAYAARIAELAAALALERAR